MTFEYLSKSDFSVITQRYGDEINFRRRIPSGMP
jgi:hypothetical protein